MLNQPHQFKIADPEMKRLMCLADNVAFSRATILITGESGTGKEVLARHIHAKSPRAHQRMISVNCAAIPADLLEGELFGHERGVIGKFELANNSTFLLDEVSELPLVLQVKLLRVIQDGEIERVGARSPLKVNVRLIATSNRNLLTMVKNGQFREDLFYRLNVIPLAIPPLRQRLRDIDELARFFTEVSGHINGKSDRRLTEDAINKLKSLNWPGNVRELENVIERTVLLSQSNFIRASDLLITRENEPSLGVDAGDRLVPGMTVAEAERRLILKTLDHTKQNRTKAADLLGISIRTLRNKLHEYGVATSQLERANVIQLNPQTGPDLREIVNG